MTNSSYSVFKTLLKSLCLQEFPCGLGSWRNPNDKYADNYSSVTTTDYGVDYEKMEILQEYLTSGTWDVDTGWSEEARMIQNMAVVEPKKLAGKKGEKLIHEYFRSLRMVDKEIGCIDADMLLLCSLETLTLSANHLTQVPSSNLPRKLKVLELCMNCLDSVVSLCKKPPQLQHLGLSHNRLYNPEEYKYFSGKYWPHLLSLDLSNNNFDQLVALVDQLASLPKLKSLVLQGNPLAMIPAYRGYTLDVMRDLIIFDEVNISADERHRFKGLARRKDNIRNEALFTVSFDTLGGVPMPEELKDHEGRDEFPVVTSQYVIRYKMLDNEKPPCEDVLEGTEPGIVVTAPDQDTAVEFESDPLSWTNWMEFDYSKQHVIDDVTNFRDFAKIGMRFEVGWKKTLSWPIEEDGADSKTPESTRGKSPIKESPSKAKEAKPKKKSAKGKKKAAESDREMRTDPPIYESLGGCNLPLTTFLERGHHHEDTLYCGGGPMVSLDELRKLHEADRVQAEEALRVDSKKKPRTISAGSKGKEKKNEVKDEETPVPPPPRPITLHVKVELKKWSTAVESLDP